MADAKQQSGKMKHPGEIAFFDFMHQKVKKIFSLEKFQPGWSGGVSVSTDGKYLLYPQVDELSSDLMMIENWK
jgi:hypothetical protein